MKTIKEDVTGGRRLLLASQQFSGDCCGVTPVLVLGCVAPQYLGCHIIYRNLTKYFLQNLINFSLAP